ncbi:Zinc finger and SCAN domain-containing protein 23, partial [Manis javanica]
MQEGLLAEKTLQAILLSGDTWAPGGSSKTPGALPSELQAWVRDHHPVSGEEVVTVLEDLERELDEPEQQVLTCAHKQKEFVKEKSNLGAAQELPCGQLQTLEEQHQCNLQEVCPLEEI